MSTYVHSSAGLVHEVVFSKCKVPVWPLWLEGWTHQAGVQELNPKPGKYSPTDRGRKDGKGVP